MILPLPSRVGRWVLALLLSLPILLVLTTTAAQASHLRAGDIQAIIDTTIGPGNNPRRVFFKMILYTDATSRVDEDAVTIFFGDGTNSGVRGIPRRGAAGPTAVPQTLINVYFFEHTYNAPGDYLISYIGENRNAGVRNMSQSDARSFYISTRIFIDPVLAVSGNRSPKLTAPAIDQAGTNQVFLHNPGAYDADGDSLTYQVIASQHVVDGVPGAIATNSRPVNVPCPGYVYPDNTSFGGSTVAYGGNPAGGTSGTGQTGLGGVDVGGNPVNYSQNPRTGQIVWNAPAQAGLYNVAFVVREYRRLSTGGRRLIGEVIRDMQIIVTNTTNRRPTINIPQDTCVVAGTSIIRTNITATDPANQRINLYAYSGIFPPATFQQTATSPVARGRFSWTPDCSNIAQLPIQIIFKAENQPASVNTPRLIDEKVWRITVIGPAPNNLVARQTSGSSVVLTWDRYTCQNASNILIFRKEGPSTWNPDACETGIPASVGYVQVGSVAQTAQSYLDEGLTRGRNYCYRIYATFPLPGGGASIASREFCVNLQGNSAVFTNVTVDQTSPTAGVITTRWTRPRTGTTTDFPTPASYRLSRATGNSTTYTVLQTITNLSDTSYVDRNLNTQANAYTYRLEFFSNGNPGGATTISETSPTASSVRVQGQANAAATQVSLSWTYAVPWNNATRPTVIYRREESSPTFVQIATVTGTSSGGTYVDQGTATVPLRSGATYCYYVQTNGTYDVQPASSPLNSLLNLSQQQCVVLAAVPCPPVLRLVNNCDSLSAAVANRPGAFPLPGETYTNYLRWTLDTGNPTGCSQDIAYYRIFYRAAESEQRVLLDSTRTNVLSYNHTGLSSQAACYTVQAVDIRNQRSAESAEVCVDNCQLFIMPNIFTPNGDGLNDTFRPKVSSPIRRTHFKAYNRWGVLVYESTSNPLIDWTGDGTNGEGTRGGKVSDGVYYYQAEVEFADLNSTTRTFKGWVQINR